MISQQHIIKKLVLELEITGDQQTAFIQQQAIKNGLVRKLSNELGEKLSQLAPKSATIQIPRLEINLGEVSQSTFDQQFVQQFSLQVAKIINTVAPSFSNKKETIDNKSKTKVLNLIPYQRNKTLFFYFLEKGSFPWWSKNINWQEWEKELVQSIDQSLIEELRQHLLVKPILINRLNQQFSSTLLKKIIEKVNNNKVNKAYLIVDSDKSSFKITLNEALYKKKPKKTNLKHQEVKETIKDTAQQAFFKAHQIKLPPSLLPKQASSTYETQTEYFINNAGLVIALPYLPLILKEFGYLDETGKFKNKKLQEKAILVAQYLVTGETTALEADLILNKIACGWPLEKSIVKAISLTKKEKAFIDTFLKEIIQHWGALKNTSPDGLRNNFFKRNGKLTLVNGHWHLQVEKISYDSFLLKKLPWTISIIKARFMNQRIHVEWIA